MHSPPPFDLSSTSDPAPFRRGSISPPPFPIKRTRFSKGVRLALGGAFVALLSLGAWIGLHLFFQNSPTGTFTLPAIPPDQTAVEAVTSPPTASPVTESDPLEKLRIELTGETSPEPGLYLEFASLCHERMVDTEATDLLREGLVRHPGNDDLLLALADNLATVHAVAEAWELVARAGRHDDHRFTSRLMRLGLDSGRADESLVILASSDVATGAWTEDDWANVVRLHGETGQFDRAIEIADRRLGNRSELFRLRSLKAKSEGQIPEAIFNLEQYLAGLGDPAASDWRLLAELYDADGRKTEADRANRQADGVE